MVKLLEDPVNRLAGYKALHGFAVGLISIFIPVYLAQSGFSPVIVFSFLLVDVTSFTLLAVPVGYVISKTGVRNSLLTSSLLYVLAFTVLQALPVTLSLITAVGLLIGVAKAFHWIPVNSEFTSGSKRESRGEEYGKLEGFPALLGPFAPLAGGAVMTYLGFSFVAAASVLLGLMSVLPLLPGGRIAMPDIEVRNSLSLDKLDLWVLYFLDGFATTAYVFIFPLFVFYVIGGALNVGAVKTIAGIGGALFALGTGRLSDRFEKKRLVLAGAAFSAVIYLLVPAIETRNFAFLLSFIAGLTYMFYTIPLVSIIADIAEAENLLGFFSVREFFQGLGKIVVVLVMITALEIGSIQQSFALTFYLTTASVIMLSLALWKVERRR